MENKKGAEMTIGTIIVIILALVVLVVIIYGFTTGWGNLWEKITGFGGGKVNVQTIVQSCQLACTTQSTYDYCTKERNVIFEKDDQKNGDYNCKALENEGVGLECDAFGSECVDIKNLEEGDEDSGIDEETLPETTEA